MFEFYPRECKLNNVIIFRCYNRDYVASTIECICKRGYWGDECENVCPGGSLHPCYNHGICNSSTGQCHCDENWSGTRDCSVCAQDWKGVDCSLALVTKTTVQLFVYAVIDTSAHYITFDGLAFHLSVVGDYYLFRTRLYMYGNITVQVRHAPCGLQSVCIVAVAVQVSQTRLVFHSPTVNEQQPIIWVSDAKVSVVASSTFGYGNSELIITRNASSVFNIRHKEIFLLSIRVIGHALALNVQLSKSNCSASGILGNCDNDPYNDLPLTNSSVGINNVSQGILNKELVRVFEVDLKDSLFAVVDNLYLRRTLFTAAKYSLYFNKNSVISRVFVKTFTYNTDLTIEVLFKALSTGTVLSYARNKTFGIIIRSTLHIEFGSDWSKDTKIYINANTWYHLTIIWHKDLHLVEIYVITANGITQRRRFSISDNPFKPGGILTFGYWEPSPGDTEARIQDGFTGVIDELRVWHRAFNPVTAQENWRMNVLPRTPSLAGLWKFNEGSGNLVHNAITNEHLILLPEVWSPPKWIVSDADIALNLSNVEKPFEKHFANVSFQTTAEEWCNALFYQGPLHVHCRSLGAVMQFYYLTCIQTISRTSQLQSTVFIVEQFSDYCQKSLKLSIWPARELCNHFNGVKFSYWIGDNCDVPCFFGERHPTKKNKCRCYKGYWGDDCSNVCPGGHVNPCNGHGVCNALDGICTCDVNWRGDVTCSVCSTNWFGKRCQYAANQYIVKREFSFASIIGQGYFTTFLGVSFYLPYHGEFYLIRSISNNFVVQVRQTPCMFNEIYRSICTTAISIRFNIYLTVSIRAPVTNVRSFYPLVWINGKAIRVDHVTIFSETVRMTRIALNRYEITGLNGMHFLLTVGQSLSIRLRLPTLLCRDSSGILGACKQRLSYQNTTDSVSLQNAIANGTVGKSDSFFIYKHKYFNEFRHILGSWCNLRLKDTHIVSDVLFLGKYDVITIEIFVKINSYGGTLLAYGKDDNYLIITSEQNMRVLYKSVSYQTGIKLTPGRWSQISIVWIKSSYVLQMYYHDYSTPFGSPLLRTYQFNSQIVTSEGKEK